MGNRNILLWNNYQDIQHMSNIDNLNNEEICEIRKKLNEHLFVDFVDIPIFLSFYKDLNNKIHSRTCSVSDFRTNDIFEIINDPKHDNKRFYIMPQNNTDIVHPLPVVYNPINFMPIRNYSVRMAIVEMVRPEMGVEIGLKNTKTIKNDDYMYILIRR
jgi:hypothetical protein